MPDAEAVVQRGPHWVVVEKRGQAGVVAELHRPAGPDLRCPRGLGHAEAHPHLGATVAALSDHELIGGIRDHGQAPSEAGVLGRSLVPAAVVRDEHDELTRNPGCSDIDESGAGAIGMPHGVGHRFGDRKPDPVESLAAHPGRRRRNLRFGSAPAGTASGSAG